ncbi:hypothetical protein HH299_12325, partial [Xanthomonas sp. Kuri4-2]
MSSLINGCAWRRCNARERGSLRPHRVDALQRDAEVDRRVGLHVRMRLVAARRATEVGLITTGVPAAAYSGVAEPLAFLPKPRVWGLRLSPLALEAFSAWLWAGICVVSRATASAPPAV